MKKEESKSNDSIVWRGIFIIINILLGLLCFGVAWSSFMDKLYILGSLSLLPAIFAFLPKKIIKISQWIKSLIIILAIIVLIALAVLFGWTIPENFIYHNMNESFILDLGTANVSMIVYNVTESTSFNGETTNGYFILINCGITNLHTSPVIINEKLAYSLNDDQNETFQGTFSGIGLMFQPNLEKETYFLFEIPKTAKGLNLHVKNFALGTHVIDLKI